MSTAAKVSVLDDVGDQFAEPGSTPWAKWFVGQARLSAQKLESDVVGLQMVVEQLEKHSAWKVLGYASFGLLWEKEVGLPQNTIEAVRKAKAGTSLAVVLAHNPVEAPTIGKRRSDNVRPSHGNSAEYMTARIARDRPDILDRMKSGEFPSVRAAAIEAGIVKKETPYLKLHRAWKRATDDERKRFLQDVLGDNA